MLQIRCNTFETNSSSTHSIVICTRKEFEDWKNGLIKFDPYNETFISSDESKIEKYRNIAIDNYKNNKDPDPYCINWDNLPKEQQEKYINSYVKMLIECEDDEGMSYDHYVNYYKENCEYSYVYYKTEHGDEVCAFGKGGYDG